MNHEDMVKNLNSGEIALLNSGMGGFYVSIVKNNGKRVRDAFFLNIDAVRILVDDLGYGEALNNDSFLEWLGNLEKNSHEENLSEFRAVAKNSVVTVKIIPPKEKQLDENKLGKTTWCYDECKVASLVSKTKEAMAEIIPPKENELKESELSKTTWYYDESKVAYAVSKMKEVAGDYASVYLSHNFAGGMDCAIEVCGTNSQRIIDALSKAMCEALEIPDDEYFLECYDSLDYAFTVGKDGEELGGPHNPIELRDPEKHDEPYPNWAIRAAHREWTKLAQEGEDVGPCVCCDFLGFEHCGKHYRMIPADLMQSSEARVAALPKIIKCLKSLGCSNVKYNEGRLD